MQRADACLRQIYEQCSRYLVALWGKNNPSTERLPKEIINPDRVEELSNRDDVVSLAEAGVLEESTSIRLSLLHLKTLCQLAGCSLVEPFPPDLLSLQQTIGINNTDLQHADELLRFTSEEADTRRRERQIGGASYVVPRGDRFDGLGAHLDQHLPVDFGANVDLFRPAPLSQPPQTATGGGSGARGPSTPRARTQRDRDLIGAVGEYCVYQLFSKKLGMNFSPDCWKSTTRRHFFPGNDGDDSLGYDFGFHHEGIEWQIEVKSSDGEPGFFELTSNEVTVARRATKKKSTRYQIIVVSDALSKEPRFTILDNPYEKKAKDHFRIDPGGSRVYFRVAAEKTLDSK